MRSRARCRLGRGACGLCSGGWWRGRGGCGVGGVWVGMWEGERGWSGEGWGFGGRRRRGCESESGGMMVGDGERVEGCGGISLM